MNEDNQIRKPRSPRKQKTVEDQQAIVAKARERFEQAKKHLETEERKLEEMKSRDLARLGMLAMNEFRSQNPNLTIDQAQEKLARVLHSGSNDNAQVGQASFPNAQVRAEH